MDQLHQKAFKSFHLLMVIFILTLTFIFHLRWETPTDPLNAIIPNRIPYTFIDDPLARQFDNSSDRYWHDHLLPKNGGEAIYVDAYPQERQKSIALLHQLHCLGMVRSHFLKLATVSGYPEELGGKGQTTLRNHLGHCFDLIRQVMLRVRPGGSYMY